MSIFEVYLRDAMTVTKGYESRRVDFVEEVRQEHRAIVEAVAAGDEQTARGAATQHHLNGERRLVTCGVLKPIKRARARR